MENRPTGAYEIGSRCEGKSTKETEQSIKEREGDGYEHCERCTAQLASHQSYLFRVRGPFGKQSFRIQTEDLSSDRGITDIDSPSNQPERQAWREF